MRNLVFIGEGKADVFDIILIIFERHIQKNVLHCGGVVSLKRGNSFLVQKKHSDYEKPNACGRM